MNQTEKFLGEFILRAKSLHTDPLELLQLFAAPDLIGLNLVTEFGGKLFKAILIVYLCPESVR